VTDQAPEHPPGGQAQEQAAVPPPTMTARLAAVVLLLEAFAVFFATLVASALLPAEGYSRGWVWGVGLALAVVCVLASGAARRPGGVAVGWAVQVLLVLAGIPLPAMIVVGVGFAALWWWLVSIGRRVDADRRRWAAELAEGRTPT